MNDTNPTDSSEPVANTPSAALSQGVSRFNPDNLARLEELAKDGYRRRSRQQRALDEAKDIIKAAWDNGLTTSEIATRLSEYDFQAPKNYCTVDATTVSRYCKEEFGSRKARKATRKSSTTTGTVPPPSPENPPTSEAS